MTCAEAACNNHEVQARTRAAAGGAFGATETIEKKETSMRGLAMASDPQGHVLLGWSEGGANVLFASMYTPPPPPEEGAGPGPGATGPSGVSGTSLSGGGTSSVPPALTLVGNPSLSSGGATVTVDCQAPQDQSCDGEGALTSAERLKGSKRVGLSARKRQRQRTKTVTVGKATFVVANGQHRTIQFPSTRSDASCSHVSAGFPRH